VDLHLHKSALSSYNMFHYNANLVTTRLQSWLPIFLGPTSSHSMNRWPRCMEIKNMQTCSHPPAVYNKRRNGSGSMVYFASVCPTFISAGGGEVEVGGGVSSEFM